MSRQEFRLQISLSRQDWCRSHNHSPARKRVAMDTGGSWYVSWQGKLQGPLPWATLQELARLGRLKPEMLLSQDRTNWALASSYDGLFAPSPRAVPPVAAPRRPPATHSPRPR